MLKVRNEFVWLWWIAAIEPIDKIILGICISSFERTICLLLAELFLQELVVRKYGKHQVSTDGGVHGIHRLVNS